MDDCFLKGYYGGQKLAAIEMDPNDQMFPIAFMLWKVKSMIHGVGS